MELRIQEIISNIAIRSDKYPEQRVKYYDTCAAYIRTSVGQSLKKLHTDRLETLLLHRPDPLMDVVDTANVLDEPVDIGKVLSVGVSNFRSEKWQSYEAPPGSKPDRTQPDTSGRLH
ncbi:MAG: aldo/keto reductase [Reinekea sp.]|jgi:predicted oxidoreductase